MTARRVAAVSCAVQGLALFGVAAFYGYELAVGEGSGTALVVMSTLLIVLAGAGLGLLARGWLGEAWWPRTPTVLWSLLLLPVGWSAVQAGAAVVGWLVVGLALVTLVAAWSVGGRSPEDEDEVD